MHSEMGKPLRIHTSTLTGKGQITVPVSICRALGLKPGARLDIYPAPNSAFEVRVRRPSRIMDFAGGLKRLEQEPDQELAMGTEVSPR